MRKRAEPVSPAGARLAAAALAACVALPLGAAEQGPVDVRVRQTPAGPAVFVDGAAVSPRFFYGSPPCLCPISDVRPREYTIPFKAEEDTESCTVRIDGFDDDAPLWFSLARLVDVTTGEEVALHKDGEEERTRHFARAGLKLLKGHGYRFSVTHRAAHFRTYFTHEVSFTDPGGVKKVLPLPYGDTLCDTVRLAAKEGVRFITFSTDTSWGCEGWWAPPGKPPAYGRIDEMCERIVAANKAALLVPRVKVDAPGWMLEQDPSIKMKFDAGYTIGMSSISARPYRKAACAEVERLVRHLREKFPENFAGIHLSGQNSAEWFYMMSQGGELSGYDVHTRDAFREYLAARGEEGAASAEVPTAAERRAQRPDGRLDPVRDRRLALFGEFRQEEMASFLCELGASVRKGSGGGVLSLFFYGYTWELGAVKAGAAETGHFHMGRLMQRARPFIDGFSAPISYTDRGWPGSMPMMAAAESVMRNGYLWIDEDDTRTHLEDLWSFPVNIGGYTNDSPAVTRNMLMRNAAFAILRGYGDWWMDLCGHGWFRDDDIWKIRKDLRPLERAMKNRRGMYSPEIAVVVDEESLMMNGWGSARHVAPFLRRDGFSVCGAPCGQYLLGDVLKNPPAAKLVFVAYARDLSQEQRKGLDEIARAGALVFEAKTPNDLKAGRIAEIARKAGVHLYSAPGDAVVCAAEGFVAVQARRAGPLKLDFGACLRAVDIVSGEEFRECGPANVNFALGETRIFVLLGS